jgi:(p)ppGpp synthase/HD superfamily hydrolase
MSKITLEKPLDLNYVLEFATEKHKGQKRDDGADYITHPIRVAKIIAEVKKDSQNRDILIAAALLHDTLEDTYTSCRELEEHFGKEVASIVVELTTAPFVPKMIGKGKYLAEKMEKMTNYALLIKLADRYDNLCDLSKCTPFKQQKTINDTTYILNYLKDKREFTSTQKILVDKINKQLNFLKENMKDISQL